LKLTKGQKKASLNRKDMVLHLDTPLLPQLREGGFTS